MATLPFWTMFCERLLFREGFCWLSGSTLHLRIGKICYWLFCIKLLFTSQWILFVWYGGLLLALYNYNGLVEPGLRLYNFHGFIFTRFGLCSGSVPCSSAVHRAPGKKAKIYMVLVRPDRELNSRPTSTEAAALTTKPRAGRSKEH